LGSAVAELGGGGSGAVAAKLRIGVHAAATHAGHADESGNANYAQSDQRRFLRQLHCVGLGSECLGDKKVNDVFFIWVSL
jgi:hypothetical protein